MTSIPTKKIDIDKGAKGLDESIQATSLKSNPNVIDNLTKTDIDTPLELMRLRAEEAESALEISNESLSSLKDIQENSLEIIEATKETVVSMQKTIKDNREDTKKKELALEELRSVVEKNRASLERSAVEYDEIHEMAFIDPLTRLPNRRLLDDRLNQIILNNRRWNSYSAAIYVDLDKFKLINDTYGHDAGDELLIAVGNRLKGCIRESDTVSRYGGDEFVVLLDHLDGNFMEAKVQAEMIANKLLTSFTPSFTLHARKGKLMPQSIEYQIFASLGVMMFDGIMTDKASIIGKADKAMYRAKSAGGKSIQFATQDD